MPETAKASDAPGQKTITIIDGSSGARKDVVVSSEGLACEATLCATAAESSGSQGRHQATGIPLGNGHGAGR